MSDTETVICCIIVSNPAGGTRPRGWQKRVNDHIRSLAKMAALQPDAAVLHMTITGLNITVVKSGTVVGKDDEGNDMLVTDETTVFNGWRAWVTQKVYDALKGETP